MPRAKDGKLVWPGPEEVNLDCKGPTFFQRWRLVIPCYDKEQADRLSERVKEICSHDKECFIAITDLEATKQLGEVVVHREAVHPDCFALSDEPSGAVT